MAIDFLLIETTTFHGQVLIPLLQQMDEDGFSWRLVLNKRHADRETILGRPGWGARVHLSSGRPLASLASVARMMWKSRPGAVMLMSPVRDHLAQIVLCSLIHKRFAMVIHRPTEFPSPSATEVEPPGRLLLRAYWSSVGCRTVAMSPAVAAELRGPRIPDPVILVPAARQTLSWRSLAGVPLRIFLPGPLLTLYKNFTPLLDALEHFDLPHVRFVVAGGRTLPHYLDDPIVGRLAADPRFELHLDDWVPHDRFLDLASGCHACLELPLTRSRYTTSVSLLANGLPRPLLSGPGGSSADWLSYRDGDELAEAIWRLDRTLHSGYWAAQMQLLDESSAALREDNRRSFSYLLGRGR